MLCSDVQLKPSCEMTAYASSCSFTLAILIATFNSLNNALAHALSYLFASLFDIQNLAELPEFES